MRICLAVDFGDHTAVRPLQDFGYGYWLGNFLLSLCQKVLEALLNPKRGVVYSFSRCL